MSPTTANIAIYIHWPFCKSKCPYCDFNSHVRESVDQAAWKSAMLAELSHMAKLSPNHTVTSIFFGGGTPSLMPAQTAEALISAIHNHWPTDPNIEITLEANPTSVETKTFGNFRAAGINRVSLGIQSLDDKALTFLGREHSSAEALAAVEQAANIFDRYSFDLIYARPNQTTNQWEKELREALTYADGHLSLYQLTIEENTAFHHAYHYKGAFSLPPDGEACELFTLTQSVMEDAGLPAYEISNHAKTGQESRHNLSYWQGEPYIGIGAGAHGRPIIDGVWYATNTLKSPERWLELAQKQGHAIELMEALTPQERMEEYVMMGLRLKKGIDLNRFNCGEMINQTCKTTLIDNGLLEQKDEQLYATAEGWLLLNHIIAELLS